MQLSPLTNSPNTETIYIQKSVPIFQNKVYLNKHDAINVVKRDVILSQCKDTGFVFSRDFDISILSYDENYQNEQSNSAYFQSHLNDVIELLQTQKLLNNKVLEIGCGKGYFLEILLEKGCDITGIDPTYEGNSTKIIKDYYSEEYKYLNAELIILRHTLEHIPDPHGFLKMIAKANGFKGKIYIEIPTFDWIVNNNAVEDVFYEHCNYFTPKTISTIFTDCQVNYVFNQQYIGIIADLSSINETIEPLSEIELYHLEFQDKIDEYYNIINTNKNLAIWGAGAKGSTFLNLVDKDCKFVEAVIDINPQKQNKFIGGTGHPIIKPEEIINYNIDTILIMNRNYKEEIEKQTNKKIITL